MDRQAIISLKVYKDNQIFLLNCQENESVLKALQRQGLFIPAVCAGRGTCGKCRIHVLEGNLTISEQDKRVFTSGDLKDGYRLACLAFPREDCVIRLMTEEEADFAVLAEIGFHGEVENNYDLNQILHVVGGRTEPEGKTEASDNISPYAIAIDIGTTTIAMHLVDIDNGNIINTYTAVNKQRAYGADVISRIQASCDGWKDSLRECIRMDLLEGIQMLMKNCTDAKVKRDATDKRASNITVDGHQVTEIVISGNTTMGHLFMGYSCETLGHYPYQPVNNGWINLTFQEAYGVEYMDLPVTMLPGISTFVGADITAGLLTCGFDRFDKPCMLIDLGTNGEMAIGNKEHIYVTSTAAGPAFEGGNITCGTGSIAGAISHVTIKKSRASYQTIGNREAIGICGTGVIELVSELLKENIIDDTGLLLPEYFEEGYPLNERIIFTQKDVRELQLAKAAIRAGVETLINCYGITIQELDRIYLAGGFGYQVDLEKAIHIGLLPQEFRGKLIAAGNTSLAGAVKYLTESSAKERMDQIIASAQEIHLSNRQEFNDLYIEYMLFEKDDIEE
ncbi:MAG: hypothetical protein K0S76_1581 [Herbinix sp.]|nr:hypothetical protein [Herbinix sp.]